MKRFRKFLNDLREPLGIGMKRLMIALTIILGIVIVTVAGWLLWSRIGMAYARNKVSDTYLQNQPAYQSFVADRDDYAYRVRYTTFYTPSDALTEMGVEKIYEEVGSCICFEQAWREAFRRGYSTHRTRRRCPRGITGCSWITTGIITGFRADARRNLTCHEGGSI